MMKKNFKRIAAWVMALAMCITCMSGAMAATTLDAGVIDVEATAEGQRIGGYEVNYSATLTMTESFAKAAAQAASVKPEQLKALRFICTLSDSLVKQLSVAAADIELDSDVFELEGVAGGKGSAIVLTYKLIDSVVDGWTSDINDIDGAGMDAVVADLTAEMKMTTKNAKTATSAQMSAAGSNINGTAVVTVDGTIPGIFVGETDASGDIIAAEGTYRVDVSEYRGSSGGPSTATYSISVKNSENGKAAANQTWASAGTKITVTVTPEDGYRLTELKVVAANGDVVEVTKSGDNTYTFTMPKGNVTVTPAYDAALVSPETSGVSGSLNTKEHIAYMNGDNKGNFRPVANITRAEVAQVFYNLLINLEEVNGTYFDDVADSAWYAKAVNTLASMEIINGVGDDKYQPERAITRAEFATIVSRFAEKATNDFDFNDVPKSHWAYSYISSAAAYGWINGAGGNQFQPERAITRAEVATIVNHMLGRIPDEAAIDAGSAREWSDVFESHWAFYEIAEATTEHDYKFNEARTEETWIAE